MNTQQLENSRQFLKHIEGLFSEFYPKANEPITISFMRSYIPEMELYHNQILHNLKKGINDLDIEIKEDHIIDIVFECFYIAEETYNSLLIKYNMLIERLSNKKINDNIELFRLFIQLKTDIKNMDNIIYQYDQLVEFVYKP